MSDETTAISSSETSVIGTTGMKPRTVVPPAVRARKSIPPAENATRGGPGGGAGTACWNTATPTTAAATQSVTASAPHFVLRLQKSAAISSGESAAKPHWLSHAARRAAFAGAAAGLVAAGLASWEHRDQLRARMPALRADAAPPPAIEPPSVDAGAPSAPIAVLEPARLRVAVFPWGEIRIDGGDPILTPRAAPIELRPGAHRIEIAHPTLGNEVREITLAAGEQRTLRHVFDRTPAR